MHLERRSLLLGVGAMLMAGCSRSTPSQAATIPKMSVDTKLWAAFKATYLVPDGRVIDGGNAGISHSEGQGYGMLIAEAAGDRAAFDSIYAWTETTLARGNDSLFSWRYVPNTPVPVSDPNNATDGDILIAWALMRAGARWRDPHLLARSAEIRAAILENCLRRQNGRTLLLPGVVGYNHPDRTTVNLAYYIWPALDQFRKAGAEPIWTAVIRDGEKLLDEARSGPLSLPTDWTDVTADNHVRVASDKPPRFGFDAVRIPLYLMLGGRTAKAASVAKYWRSFVDQGKPIPAWVDTVTGETAPYPLSTGGNAIATRLLGKAVVPSAVSSDYYSHILLLLASLR